MYTLKDLSDGDFQLFRKLIYQKSGISLNDTKKELLRSRLRSRLEKAGYQSYREYYNYVLEDSSDIALVQLLDDISTNLTSFYREINHFQYLDSMIPLWIEQKQKKGDKLFRVWSAGCSTGEEPYTITFVLLRHLTDKMGVLGMKLLATDLSTDVLRRASEGVYNVDRMKGVPNMVKSSYFEKELSDNNKKQVRVRKEVRDLITFRRFNLMTEHFPFKHQFDFIFCRNVMIYFDKPTQETLVGKYHRHLKPGGYLFIGHSESLTGLKHSFEYVQPTIYQK